MSLTALREMFGKAATEDEHCIMVVQASRDCLEFLFAAEYTEQPLDTKVLDEAFIEHGWSESHLFTWDEFQIVATRLFPKSAENTAGAGAAATAEQSELTGQGAVAAAAATASGTGATSLLTPAFGLCQTAPAGDMGACGQDDEARPSETQPYTDHANPEQQKQHDDMMNLMDEVEYVELKSFIEQRKHEYMTSHPGDGQTAPKVVESDWNACFYNYWLRRFLVQKSLPQEKFAHKMVGDMFVSLIPPGSMEEARSQAEANDLTRKMKLQYIDQFDAALWARWKQLEQQLMYMQEEPFGGL